MCPTSLRVCICIQYLDHYDMLGLQKNHTPLYMATPGNYKWPEVPKGHSFNVSALPIPPKHTIEQEIENFATFKTEDGKRRTKEGTLNMFIDFMLKTKNVIFMAGVRNRRTAEISQSALTQFTKMLDIVALKPTVETKMAALYEALAYLKRNYQTLFPNNRIIGAYDPKTGVLAPSRLVDPDDFFVAKWRKIATGGDYEREGLLLEQRIAKFRFTGGRRTRRQHHRRAVTRRRRNMRR